MIQSGSVLRVGSRERHADIEGRENDGLGRPGSSIVFRVGGGEKDSVGAEGCVTGAGAGVEVERVLILRA